MQILKFSTPSCGQCRIISQRLKSLDIPFKEIDCSTTEGGILASEYNISHVPVIVLTDDQGKETQRFSNLPSILSAIRSGVLGK